MNDRLRTIGIIGGYGTTGKITTEYLIKNTDCQIIAAGKNPEKHAHWAKKYHDRVTLQKTDLYNNKQLQELCASCGIIINAAGPSVLIGDRIAIQALDLNCHYIDLGGYDLLYDQLLQKNNLVLNKDLHFIIGAGWMPGVSGILPRHAIETANSTFDRIESVKIYYGAVEAWSFNSSYDLAWASNQPFNGIYENGHWKPINSSKLMHKKWFHEIGQRKSCNPFFDNQLKETALNLKVNHFGTYVMLNDYRSALSYLYNKLFLKNNRKKAARMIEKDSKRLQKKEGSWGLITCEITGFTNNSKNTLKHSLAVEDNYYPTGIVPALAAKQIIDSEIKNAGMDYLCQKVNPENFMEILGGCNIRYQTELYPSS
ncbi:hypothetical protein DMA11_11735 [Marinilabiliaceae bacterium JC017]|nr:hypothetical protein DMA11_11735 [Marinilabiliaceae bacterium JC017]